MAENNISIDASQVRPGTYFNFSTARVNVNETDRGIAVIPLYKSSYGPSEEFIKVTAANSSSVKHLLGCNPTDILLIKEALKKATTVYAYLLAEGTKATSLTSSGVRFTAKYGGSRGNSIRVSISLNPVNGVDVDIYLSGKKVESFSKVTISTISELSSKYIDIDTTGLNDDKTLSDLVSVSSLTGGTDAESKNADLIKFLDRLETIKFNAVAFPIPDMDASAQAAVRSKIMYMRTTMGKTGQFVVPNFAADYEGVINVTNGVILEDGTEVDAVNATAYVAGITAGASMVGDNTYKTYEGAVSVLGAKSNEEATVADENGEFFFILNHSGKVVIECDLSSAVTFSEGKSEGLKRNRFIRVIDSLVDDLNETFPPGTFDNIEDGWSRAEGLGRSILTEYESAGAIKDVDTSTDFLVDRSKSENSDSMYIIVAVKPIGSAEKIYITIVV